MIRSVYRDHTKSLMNELETTTDRNSASELMAIKKCIEEKMAEISQLDNEIRNQVDEENKLKEELHGTLQFSDVVTRTLTKIDGLVSDLNLGRGKEKMSAMKTDTHAKLPKLEVPAFNGDILSFRGFWDQFQAAIHLRTDLENIQKFGYLKSLLKGSAADLISGISLSDTNYSEAVELLLDSFGNSQSLISTHMDQLVTLPTVRDIRDVKMLRKVYDRLEINIRNLTDLAVNTESYGALLISIVFDRIPEDLQVIVSREMRGATWTLEKFMEIFKIELQARERCVSIKNSENDNDLSEPFTSQSLQISTKRKEKFGGTGNSSSSGNKSRKCVYCKSTQHIPSRCDVVSNPKARLRLLKNNTLCFVCLKPSHRAAQCKIDYKCVKCGSKHHVSICEKIKETPEPKTENDDQANERTVFGLQTFSERRERKGDVILQSAMGKVSDPDNSNNYSNARLLFDACSQRTYITDDLRNRFNLKINRTEKVNYQLSVLSPLTFSRLTNEKV